MDQIRDELVKRSNEFRSAGSELVSISLNVRLNAIDIRMNGPIDEAQRTLVAEYGEAVQVSSGKPFTTTACSSRLACDPWRGGIKISPGDGTGVNCTYGFNVRSKTSSTRYMMTAGHCDNENWRHNGDSIGTTNLNNLQTSGSIYGDFQRVPTFLASPNNLVYVSDTDKARTITSYRAYRDQILGDYVCASGITRGYRCGFITDDDLYYGVPFHGNIIYMWGKLAGFRSDGGDSGGPVFNSHTALGIVSAADGTTASAYGPIDQAMTALGIRMCLDSLCS
jgi:hypothetical protein